MVAQYTTIAAISPQTAKMGDGESHIEPRIPLGPLQTLILNFDESTEADR